MARIGRAPLIILAICIALPAALSLPGCSSCSAEVPPTHAEALEFLKKEVLSKHRDELRAVGTDESIFEDVYTEGSGEQACDKPKPRYSPVFGLREDVLRSYPPAVARASALLIELYEVQKGDCQECWDKISIIAGITWCGDIYDLRISHGPSWRPSRKGPTEQCGPLGSS